MDIFRSEGIGPLSVWVDDHVFFRVRCTDLAEYNRRRAGWNQEIATRGRHQTGGRLWYGGAIFEDGTVEEFDEDCQFTCQDLASQARRLPESDEYAYNFADIDKVSEKLGIPWEVSKDVPFGFQVTYIRFDWDLQTRSVVLGLRKKEKYIAAILEWQSHKTHQLNDVERLYGKLLHACLVIPSGRAYLTGLEAMLVIFHDRPFVPRSADKRIRGDLQWWLAILNRTLLSRPIPRPLNLSDVRAFSDASSGVGIAIIIFGRWRAWRLIPGWQTLNGQCDIGWAESIGFKLLV